MCYINLRFTYLLTYMYMGHDHSSSGTRSTRTPTIMRLVWLRMVFSLFCACVSCIAWWLQHWTGIQKVSPSLVVTVDLFTHTRVCVIKQYNSVWPKGGDTVWLGR